MLQPRLRAQSGTSFGAEPFKPERGSTEYIEGGDTGGRITDPAAHSSPPFSLRPNWYERFDPNDPEKQEILRAAQKRSRTLLNAPASLCFPRGHS
jgi:hypothetical protein